MLAEDGLRQAAAGEAERIEEDSLYSSRGHFTAAGRWRAAHLWHGGITAAASATAGFFALASFEHHDAAATLVAFLVAASIGVGTFLDPREVHRRHLDAGNNYRYLQNRTRRFRTVTLPSGPVDAASEQLGALAGEADRLNRSSPQIPRWAYEEAREEIEAGEADYAADKVGLE